MKPVLVYDSQPISLGCKHLHRKRQRERGRERESGEWGKDMRGEKEMEVNKTEVTHTWARVGFGAPKREDVLESRGRGDVLF